MKYEYIEPFIKATKNTFAVTLGMEAKTGKPFPFDGKKSFLDISASIGLAGEIKGIVMLNFTIQNSLDISKKFTGIQSKEADETVTDAIGELVNIVAGNAKEGLMQYRIYISLPEIAQKTVSLVLPKNALCMVIPFKALSCDFNLIVALAEDIPS